jgi:murein DD-endopeptidase MepM/ murein hydrolase activator NlpD
VNVNLAAAALVASVVAAAAAIGVAAQTPAPQAPPVAPDGGGALAGPTDQLSEAARVAAQAEIDRNVAELRRAGRLRAPRALPESLAWPLRPSGVPDPGYSGISNFVDHNAAYPNQLRDYTCGQRTYDLASGYNHGGTDIFSWPFGWLKMDNQQVEISAAAAGTIVSKSDGNFDRSCTFNNNQWNAVYVYQADGSVGWYGHMKSGSLTLKGVGDSVAAGEYLGRVGSSGSSTGPHLHFEIHDGNGALIDPFEGACYTPPSGSWWQSQRPYRDSAVNAITTGAAAVSFGSCPAPESPNVRWTFAPGATIYFTTYYRDQVAGQATTYTIRRPDGGIYSSWMHTSPATYDASYWYWYFTNFAPFGPTGTWSFEVAYLGHLYTATFTIGLTPFTDTALIPGATAIRAVHVAELRARIDAIRGHLGLAGYPWTDAPLTANTTVIKAVHMTELRAALAEAYIRSGRAAPIYATPAPAPGQLVTAGTIAELRTAVAAIE